VVFENAPDAADVPHAAVGTPAYDGLPLDRYFAMVEMPNPMHRIWSSNRWNKLPLAHGCYWHQCRFCDAKLDYIRRYSAAPVEELADRIEAVIRQTGQTGFHFVDEAASPTLLGHLADVLTARRLSITWWGNVRFESAFTPELAGRLARAGCIAVTGGLEVATDRHLARLQKGFTLDQAARVTRAFADAGIMVHAYLMYGCPGQTAQDTVDALEFVRQLFGAGFVQSAYWHRFALTVHSPIYDDPAAFGIQLLHRRRATFARNEVPYRDSVRCDHAALGRGLRKSVYNYMRGVGFDLDVREWFDIRVPPPTLEPDFVARAAPAPCSEAVTPPRLDGESWITEG